MKGETESGFLILADLSGYTSFMAKSELDHSQAIVREVLELVSGQLSPFFTLVEVEGDALFVYAPVERVQRGETVLELIEATYGQFRNRLNSLKRQTTCGCIACSMIQLLDLKFFVHFGTYVPQRIAGKFKLIGSDVNLVHRLSKNHVTEAKGWNGYVLFSDAALERLGVRPAECYRSVERYEHLGDVTIHALDLHTRYEALNVSRRSYIAAADADVAMSTYFPCAPSVLWEWLNDSQKRSMWMEGTTWTALPGPGGRTGPGSRNHCAHGKSVSIEEITDWRPFEYFSTVVHQGPITIRDTMILEPVEGGTNLAHHIRMDMPLPRFLIRPVARFIVSKVMKVEQCWARIQRFLTQEPASDAHPAARAVAD